MQISHREQAERLLRRLYDCAGPEDCVPDCDFDPYEFGDWVDTIIAALDAAVAGALRMAIEAAALPVERNGKPDKAVTVAWLLSLAEHLEKKRG